MRLGQLARRLSLRPNQLVDFLADNGFQIDPNSNTRLEDQQVTLIVQHYAPESLTSIESEPDEVQEIVQPVSVQEEIIDSVVEEEPSTEEISATELPDIIRVPKVELSGLKVLGKIELPEPKKKEPVAEEEAVTENSEIISAEKPEVERPVRQRGNNRKPHQNKDRSQRPRKNPIELKRERDTREAEEKKRRETEREREKRKRHYEEKIKSLSQPQPKRSKPSKNQFEEKKKPVDTRPVPKTWLGKFLRWWTT
jgi:hypothetical protein